MRTARAAGHLVLGAGPAGLTAGYLLARRGERVVVLEAGDQVGGLARTEVRDGYRFDLGGHRFFTKSAEVEALWLELLGDELLLRPRLSRIHWRGRFIDYPLRAGDVVARSARSSSPAAPPPTRAARLRRAPRGGDLRGVGHAALRTAAVRALLPLLHREGLGRADLARSAPSGRRSGSAGCRSGARRGPRSARRRRRSAA